MEPFSVLTAVAGALGLGTVIGNLVTSYRQRRDRREEREAARDEAHRSDLRKAYAEFISAYSLFLDEGTLLVQLHRAQGELVDETMEDAIRQGYNERHAANLAVEASQKIRERRRVSLDRFVAASSDSNTKAISLLLIDDNAERRGTVQPLADFGLITPQTEDDYMRFEADLKRLRGLLDAVRGALIGAFSPERWHDAVAKQRALRKRN